MVEDFEFDYIIHKKRDNKYTAIRVLDGKPKTEIKEISDFDEFVARFFRKIIDDGKKGSVGLLIDDSSLPLEESYFIRRLISTYNSAIQLNPQNKT